MVSAAMADSKDLLLETLMSRMTGASPLQSQTTEESTSSVPASNKEQRKSGTSKSKKSHFEKDVASAVAAFLQGTELDEDDEDDMLDDVEEEDVEEEEDEEESDGDAEGETGPEAEKPEAQTSCHQSPGGLYGIPGTSTEFAQQSSVTAGFASAPSIGAPPGLLTNGNGLSMNGNGLLANGNVQANSGPALPAKMEQLQALIQDMPSHLMQLMQQIQLPPQSEQQVVPQTAPLIPAPVATLPQPTEWTAPATTWTAPATTPPIQDLSEASSLLGTPESSRAAALSPVTTASLSSSLPQSPAPMASYIFGNGTPQANQDQRLWMNSLLASAVNGCAAGMPESPGSTGSQSAGISAKLSLENLVLSQSPPPSSDVHPSLKRGQILGLVLKRKPLPQGITAEDVKRLDGPVQHIVRSLMESEVLPTISKVQQVLKMQGYTEAIVAGLVNLCAIYSNVYCLWVPKRGEMSITLLETPLPSIEHSVETQFMSIVAGKFRDRVKKSTTAPGTNILGKVPAAVGFVAGVSDAAKAVFDMNELLQDLKRQGATTLMLKNLPVVCTQLQVVDELHASGFKGCYDFFHMPAAFASGLTLGYAFVNLTKTDHVEKFVRVWHNSRKCGIPSEDPPIKVAAAAVQGKDENVKNFAPRMKRIRNPALRPVIIGGAEK
eukprot:TRINITY_DN16683_c0_g1_i1.p1 TRINITY_DN16683_c0_g1~~TRINITY_DN16683_c0_g1_i1.p1  ORF type:complete len:663 (-),score=157.81 TRINITY_DN16683_c0_g1_i1:44-2032(-)